jgi:hypothetical protein
MVFRGVEGGGREGMSSVFEAILSIIEETES